MKANRIYVILGFCTISVVFLFCYAQALKNVFLELGRKTLSVTYSDEVSNIIIFSFLVLLCIFFLSMLFFEVGKYKFNNGSSYFVILLKIVICVLIFILIAQIAISVLCYRQSIQTYIGKKWVYLLLHETTISMLFTWLNGFFVLFVGMELAIFRYFRKHSFTVVSQKKSIMLIAFIVALTSASTIFALEKEKEKLILEVNKDIIIEQYGTSGYGELTLTIANNEKFQEQINLNGPQGRNLVVTLENQKNEYLKNGMTVKAKVSFEKKSELGSIITLKNASNEIKLSKFKEYYTELQEVEHLYSDLKVSSEAQFNSKEYESIQFIGSFFTIENKEDFYRFGMSNYVFMYDVKEREDGKLINKRYLVNFEMDYESVAKYENGNIEGYLSSWHSSNYGEKIDTYIQEEERINTVQQVE